MSRRRFLRRAIFGAAALLGGRAIWSLARERHSIRIRRIKIRLPLLPRSLEGFTICQLSDLHRGPLVSEEHIRRGAALAMSLRPDLIVLTGDYVSGSASHAESCGRALSSLGAPHGVYGVLGNHDYWSRDAARVSRTIAEAGVHILSNESVRIGSTGEALWLCGLDDVWSGSPDLTAALGEEPDDGFKILLCHEPDFADIASTRKIPLQLSGHSHGGQVRVPGIGALLLPYLGRRYPIGLRQVKDSLMVVYTNVGLGLVFPPVRFNCPPEVTHLTLMRPRPHGI